MPFNQSGNQNSNKFDNYNDVAGNQSNTTVHGNQSTKTVGDIGESVVVCMVEMGF